MAAKTLTREAKAANYPSHSPPLAPKSRRDALGNARGLRAPGDDGHEKLGKFTNRSCPEWHESWAHQENEHLDLPQMQLRLRRRVASRRCCCEWPRGCLTSVIPQLVPKRRARIQRSIATAGRSAIFAVHRTTASVITAISAHLATASAVMANEASAVAVSTVPASNLALADDGAYVPSTLHFSSALASSLGLASTASLAVTNKAGAMLGLVPRTRGALG